MIADQVDVVLQVQDAQYRARIKADETAFLNSMSSIEAASTRAGTALNVVGTRGVANVNALSTSTRNLSNNTGNLAAQFNDIGVQLAGGQSPFLIALQQGSQINQVLGQAGAGGAVRALGAAFMSLLNPVSLATIAIIAVAGTAIQYFGSILGDGAASNETLKEQNDLIRRVAENWGDAVPALRAYVDELDRAASGADLGEATRIAQTELFADFLPQIEELGLAFDVLRETTADSVEESENLDRAYDDLITKMHDGSAGADDFARLLDLLSGSQLANTETGQILIGILNQMAGAFNTAAAAAANLGAQTAAALGGPDGGDTYRDRQASQFQFAAEQERINGLTTDQLTLENEIARVRSEASRDDIILTERQALDIATARLSAEERRAAIIKSNNASNKAGASSANETERERQAVLDLIAALEFEQSLLGMSSAEKAVQNALRRAGAAATDEERAAIEELIMATAAERDALAASEQAMQAFQNLATNALTSFISDLRDGKSAAEALSNVFDNIADQLINMAVQGLVQAAFGGLFGGGGGLGGLFGGLFGGGRGFASGTANTGGMRGQPMGVVHGQEAVIPLPSGGRVPVQIQGGGQGGTIEVMATMVVENGNLVPVITQVSGTVAGKAVQQYDSQLQSRNSEKDARYG